MACGELIMNEMPVKLTVGLTRKLASFASSFTLASAPAVVIANAKLAILDCLGVSVFAVKQEIGAATLAFARDQGCMGPCTVWGTGLTASPRDAALCNGILSHGLDFDDRNHSSTFTLAAGLAVAEQHDLSGARALEAFIVGREVRNTLDKLFSDRNSGVGPGARGWHSNGILGPLAAACSAGNALRLDERQMLHAIGLAAGACGALTRDGGTMAKPFRTGHAAATGLTCVLLARSGFSADETVLEGRYGLLEALSPIPDAAIQSLGKDLGTCFHLEGGIKVKPLASCTATHSATEAMLRLRQKHALDPQEVEQIECDLKPYPLLRQHPERGFEGRFSMPFCLAVTLVRGALAPDDFTDELVNDRTVQGLIHRTRHTPGACELVVTLCDGTRLVEDLAPASNLLTPDEINKKFHQCTDDILSPVSPDAVIGMVERLDTLALVRELTQALRTDIR
jgi:2-methylcitrate dehydratase PrpD